MNDAEAALQSQQVRVNKLAALPEQPDGDEPDADAQQAQQQQAEAAVQSATGNLHGKQDALQRTGLAQQTLVMQVSAHILQSRVLCRAVFAVLCWQQPHLPD